MLVTQNCTSSKLNFDIFYKYQKLLFFMSISKPQQTRTRTDIAQLRTNYEIYLKKLDLTQSTDRWVFANMTVSLIEVLSKDRITNTINDFSAISEIKEEYLTLLIHSKPHGPKINEMEEGKNLGLHCSDCFSYQSAKVLRLVWTDFSLVSGFSSEIPPTEKMNLIIRDSSNKLDNKQELLKYLFDFYNKRNFSSHNMMDYDRTEANVIQDHLKEFVDIILDLYTDSLQVRRMNVDRTKLSLLQFDQSKLKQLLEKQIDFCKKYIAIFNYAQPEFDNYFQDKDHNMGNLWKYNGARTKQVKKQLEKILIKLEIKESTT